MILQVVYPTRRLNHGFLGVNLLETAPASQKSGWSEDGEMAPVNRATFWGAPFWNLAGDFFSWQWNITMWNRRYIFVGFPWVFHCHVSFSGVRLIFCTNVCCCYKDCLEPLFFLERLVVVVFFCYTSNSMRFLD